MVFNKILGAIAGDYNQRQLNKIQPLVKKINDFDAEYDALTDEQIKAKTPEFKARLIAGETLDDILPEAFAVVKQACKRMKGMECDVKGQIVVWDMVPYDVQLVGGIVLHQGSISEMKTGEGKTLVATLPTYLNALAGKGVHVVTVNDYLASRDSQWMAYLYNRLGLSCGSVVKGTPVHTRREEYSKDITYVENSELGFDYLRDNLTRSLSERNVIWRPLFYAIVDEVDSILIDEARTPLIISQPSSEPTEKYAFYAKIVRLLKPSAHKKKVPKGFLAEVLGKDEEEEDDGDYHIDEKNKNVTLSGLGITKLEKILNVENLYKDFGFDEIHHIENALKAEACYVDNKDYIVHDGEILIVDEHTGRTMPGRRYSEGLHQAIEAKENVTIQRESQTLATITYQNFFKLYEKLAGMTGTATTEGEEFEKIYELEVLSIPTNREVIRVDQNDKVYFNQNAKWAAVVDYIKFYHEAGVPILIGTSSIHTSELMSGILRNIQVQHYVLNAKFHQQEAEIVTNAGKLSSVVVATNMAGRGTDIKLEKGLHEKVGANYVKWVEKTLEGNTFSKVPPQIASAILFSEKEYNYTMDAFKSVWGMSDEQIEQAKKGTMNNGTATMSIEFNKGKKISEQWYAKITIKPANVTATATVEREFHYGLFILGTEKHESRRIDNQLRGRAGRQGDPGLSVFFVALDDEIMRKMGGEKIQSIAGMLLPKNELETLELTQKQFTSSIVRAQKQMEGWNFSIRKHLFDYDSVINRQRQRIYTKRDEMLKKEEAEQAVEENNGDATMTTDTATVKEIKGFIADIVGVILERYETAGSSMEEAIESIRQDFALETLPIDKKVHNLKDLYAELVASFEKTFDEKIAGAHPLVVDHTLRLIYLSMIDKYWIAHIDDMQYLRDKVGLYGYAQQDPLIMYKKEAFDKFEKLMFDIKQETIAIIFRTDFVAGNAQTMIHTDDQENLVMLDRLQEASQDIPEFTPYANRGQGQPTQPNQRPMPQNYQQAKQQQYANAFSEDGIEVVETSAQKTQPQVNDGKKYGRNDLVTMISPSGKEEEMKYKKAEGLMSQGWTMKG